MAYPTISRRAHLSLWSRRRGAQRGQAEQMSRVAVANHAKLSWLLLRGALRRVAGRANGHPLLRWPLIPLRADRLLIAPQDLRTADATRATEIYSGRFALPERSSSAIAARFSKWSRRQRNGLQL